MAKRVFKPTKKMASAARHGLRLHDKFDRGGTEVGLNRAHQLAEQRDVDAEDVKAMHAYFARHAVDKQHSDGGWGTDKDSSAGYIAWLLWGGDAGKAWANRKREKL